MSLNIHSFIHSIVPKWTVLSVLQVHLISLCGFLVFGHWLEKLPTVLYLNLVVFIRLMNFCMTVNYNTRLLCHFVYQLYLRCQESGSWGGDSSYCHSQPCSLHFCLTTKISFFVQLELWRMISYTNQPSRIIKIVLSHWIVATINLAYLSVSR